MVLSLSYVHISSPGLSVTVFEIPGIISRVNLTCSACVQVDKQQKQKRIAENCLCCTLFSICWRFWNKTCATPSSQLANMHYFCLFSCLRLKCLRASVRWWGNKNYSTSQWPGIEPELVQCLLWSFLSSDCDHNIAIWTFLEATLENLWNFIDNRNLAFDSQISSLTKLLVPKV